METVTAVNVFATVAGQVHIVTALLTRICVLIMKTASFAVGKVNAFAGNAYARALAFQVTSVKSTLPIAILAAPNGKFTVFIDILLHFRSHLSDQ